MSVCIVTVLLRTWYRNNKHFSELAAHHGGKTVRMDTEWRSDVSAYEFDF